MKEPRVDVGIMFEPQIDFVLQGNYLWNSSLVTGSQNAVYSEGKILWNGSAYEELLFEPSDSANDSFELLDVTIHNQCKYCYRHPDNPDPFVQPK
jgi:hypothetical protein